MPEKGKWLKGFPKESGMYHRATADGYYAGTANYIPHVGWIYACTEWDGYYWSIPIEIPSRYELVEQIKENDNA